MNIYRLLADLTVVVHLAYVAFVVVGFVLILVGIVAKWQWVRNFWFRLAHFLAIALVVVESAFGVTCPLTTWEHQLRGAGGGTVQEGSFMGRLAHDLMFYDGPEWVFTLCYCLFGAAVLGTLLFAPPRWPRRR